jgi:hypothetical protein
LWTRGVYGNAHFAARNQTGRLVYTLRRGEAFIEITSSSEPSYTGVIRSLDLEPALRRHSKGEA